MQGCSKHFSGDQARKWGVQKMLVLWCLNRPAGRKMKQHAQSKVLKINEHRMRNPDLYVTI